ncbi:hypothetical protein RFI_16748, partial [Reticulomyxa filosa]
MSIQTFQILKDLPTPLSYSQCVLHKHELLFCGGVFQRACYSYHTLKNKYKFICSYPSTVELNGHCVVKLADNNSKDSNEITLLSFGGLFKHTIMMKYVSVWGSVNKKHKSKKKDNYNKWVPFTDNHNHSINFGRENDDYQGARAVIGGINNNLLFITYYPNNINVFDLNTFQFVKHDILPIATNNWIKFHCFVLKSNTKEERNDSKKKDNNEMLLFCLKIGLSIEYDENNNTFQFHQLP